MHHEKLVFSKNMPKQNFDDDIQNVASSKSKGISKQNQNDGNKVKSCKGKKKEVSK